MDGTFRRTDGTLSTHKLMSVVSPTGRTSYHVNLVASPGRYEADNFAATVETVFTSFEVE